VRVHGQASARLLREHVPDASVSPEEEQVMPVQRSARQGRGALVLATTGLRATNQAG
jgi:hypothetical protein